MVIGDRVQFVQHVGRLTSSQQKAIHNADMHLAAFTSTPSIHATRRRTSPYGELLHKPVRVQRKPAIEPVKKRGRINFPNNASRRWPRSLTKTLSRPISRLDASGTTTSLLGKSTRFAGGFQPYRIPLDRGVVSLVSGAKADQASTKPPTVSTRVIRGAKVPIHTVCLVVDDAPGPSPCEHPVASALTTAALSVAGVWRQVVVAVRTLSAFLHADTATRNASPNNTKCASRYASFAAGGSRHSIKPMGT